MTANVDQNLRIVRLKEIIKKAFCRQNILNHAIIGRPYIVVMNDTILNSTTVTSLSNYYQYIGFGLFAILSNGFLFLVLALNKDLFKKSAFIFGLAVGDLIDGLSLFVSGIFRIYRTYDQTINLMVHPSVCMSQMISPLFILGNEIPGVMFFFIGLERFIAIKYFAWYHNKWSDKMSWMLTAIAYTYSMLSLASAIVVAFTRPLNTVVPYSCGTPTVVGTAYIGYNYGVGFVGGTVGAAITTVSLFVFRNRHKQTFKENSEFPSNHKQTIKRQYKITKALCLLSILDFALVALPNLLAILTTSNVLVANIGGWMLQLICFRGGLNFFIYIFINQEFRLSIMTLFHCNLNNSVSSTVF